MVHTYEDISKQHQNLLLRDEAQAYTAVTFVCLSTASNLLNIVEGTMKNYATTFFNFPLISVWNYIPYDNPRQVGQTTLMHQESFFPLGSW